MVVLGRGKAETIYPVFTLGHPSIQAGGKGIAFVMNFLWVMVIGLLGSSLSAIVEELGISYALAGLFFTL